MTIHKKSNSYDYIFAGGGMAALSMAYYLNASTLRDKSILIIDRDEKNSNDHTYCFWETGSSVFEPIVAHKWNQVWFYGTENFSALMPLNSFQYKMIHGIDFYRFVFGTINKNPNIKFLKADISEILLDENPKVVCSEGVFEAREYVFDSIFRPKYDKPSHNNLMQHFLGWVIETDRPYFKLDEPTLFDFRIYQKDEFRFVYVLPISPKKALIEFTIFSDNLLQKDEYNFYLKNYIENTLKIEGYQINVNEYRISETEFGIVPMSDEKYETFPADKIVRIGTAGGYIKSSSGYSFQRSQLFLQKLVKAMEAKQALPSQINNSWKAFLDAVLLNVMAKKRTSQAEIFTLLFKKNGAERVMQFLSEETNLIQDIKLMNTVPKMPFIKAAMVEIKKKIGL